MLKPIRVGKLLAGNLGSSNEAVLEKMNPNTKLYLSEKPNIEVKAKVESRLICWGLHVREMCYPVLRIGDTIWDVDFGMFTWNGREWK